MALPFLMEVEMKIEDMIMVIENRKGVETNMLCTLTEFVVNFVARGNKDQITILDEVLKLQETKQLNFWVENYEAANVSVNAKYCCSENELQIFLLGHLNDCEHEFSVERSSEACVKQLEVLGFDINGTRLPGAMPKYEKMDREFEQGDVIRNLNGNTYRIMEKYSDRNMLFMDVNQGNFVVGLNVEFFAKYPRTEDKFSENCQYGIEWYMEYILVQLPQRLILLDFVRSMGKQSEKLNRMAKRLLILK